jgi:hypothetical protein
MAPFSSTCVIRIYRTLVTVAFIYIRLVCPRIPSCVLIILCYSQIHTFHLTSLRAGFILELDILSLPRPHKPCCCERHCKHLFVGAIDGLVVAYICINQGHFGERQDVRRGNCVQNRYSNRDVTRISSRHATHFSILDIA